jgi:predicted amidohydrolase
MPRKARIVTTCQDDDVAGDTAGLVERSLSLHPDLVCLPECFSKLGIPGGADFEPVPGPTTEHFMAVARRNRCHIICPLKTERDGVRRNSAVVIDRSGGIAGIYDKVHPVTARADYSSFEGVRPGEQVAVFDLDFGRIGIQICFDIGFPEGWADLERQGARLVFWPSAYTGGFPLQAYAWLHHYYVISAVRTDCARIIDPCGRVLAETTRRQKLAWLDINPDFVVAHNDFNYRVPGAIQAAYGDRVVVRTYAEEGHFLIEPADDGLTTDRLREEFAFESTRQYHDRHRRGYAQIGRGEAAAPQRAAHGERPHWAE